MVVEGFKDAARSSREVDVWDTPERIQNASLVRLVSEWRNDAAMDQNHVSREFIYFCFYFYF